MEEVESLLRPWLGAYAVSLLLDYFLGQSKVTNIPGLWEKEIDYLILGGVIKYIAIFAIYQKLSHLFPNSMTGSQSLLKLCISKRKMEIFLLNSFSILFSEQRKIFCTILPLNSELPVQVA